MSDKYKQMLPLNLPNFDIKVKKTAEQLFVWDETRRKYITLTPEEWVRQHFVHFLVSEKGYRQELIANEVSIKLNETTKRCDTIIYDRQLTPLMIVEYKAPTIIITPKVFDQIVRYNMVLHVQYLTVSNGLRHFCCQINYETQSYRFLKEIPDAQEIGQMNENPLSSSAHAANR